MRKIIPFVIALMLCSVTVQAQESEQFNNALNSVFPRLNSANLLKSLPSAPAAVFDAFDEGKIFIKIIGNEDYNKVMLILINNTAGSLDLFMPEGITTIRNPCTASTYYSFYTPERMDINLGQEDKFILINQVGSTLIVSGNVLFTDVSCSYDWFTTSFTSYYDPIPDEVLQELLPFNPDTSTLQQVFGDADGNILILRNYDNTGMNSRHIYLDGANEGEIYTEFTDDWKDDAFESLSTHDFIVELDDNNKKILKSVENPTIKITNTGIQGVISSIFTIIVEVIDIDEIAPELSAVDSLLYETDFIEVTSTEDGIIYLVPKDTNKDLTSIRGASIDSVAALANSSVNISLSGLNSGIYWLYARDATGNISDPEAFTIYMETDREAPDLYVTEDSLYQKVFIKAISTEDGFIYLVPQFTSKDLANIRGVCMDSVPSKADDVASINISGLGNGKYWLYARDGSGNISEYKEFTIAGVGIDNKLAGNIRIFPSPTHDLITVQTREPGEYSIEIISMNGIIHLSRNFIGETHQIDITSFRKGVYVITVRSKDFVATGKIIKL